MYQVRIKTFEDVENNQQCGGGIWTWIRNKSYLDSFLERHVLKSVLFLFYHRNLPKRIWIFWPMRSRHSDNKLSPLCLVKKPGPHKTFWPIRTENSIVRYITTQLGLVVCSELYIWCRSWSQTFTTVWWYFSTLTRTTRHTSGAHNSFLRANGDLYNHVLLHDR